MFTTSERREIFNNRAGQMCIQFEHVIQVSSKNLTSETERYHIIDESDNTHMGFDRKQMRDVCDLLLMMRDKGQL